MRYNVDMNKSTVKRPSSAASARARRHGKTKYIFIVLTRTNGCIPQIIRTVTGDRYNHASVAFSCTPHLLYSFARIQSASPLVGGPVAEYLCRFTRGSETKVPTVVFAVPVTPEVYRRIKATVRRIYGDGEYMYNLISVVSYPLFGGFDTYNAYSCSEFVAMLLNMMGIDIGGRPCGCRPDDLFAVLSAQTDTCEIYRGDIRGFLKEPRNRPCRRDDFFAPFDHNMVIETGKYFFELGRRALGKHDNIHNIG